MIYRIVYNVHRYQDHSDPVKQRVKRIDAPSLEDAMNAMYVWRDSVQETGIETRNGSKLWVGMIHVPAEAQS